MVLRHDWTYSEIDALYNLSFNELISRAQNIHQQFFKAHEIQVSTLLSVKTGACPEDCRYCSQSAHYKTGLNKENLLPLETVIAQAKVAKANGASRFCIGAAWRSLPKKESLQIVAIIKSVKALGLETCATLGMLDDEQVQQLKSAGLDYYNHNLDTSPEYYPSITTTRTYQDRLETLERVHKAAIKVCCGGIIGMGEKRSDRINLLLQLATMPYHPQSVPINLLIPIKGTPLEKVAPLDNFEFVRTIAVARLLMPTSFIRLSAGRTTMSEEMQALCFLAGANSLFLGEKLLTTENPAIESDKQFLAKLGMEII